MFLLLFQDVKERVVKDKKHFFSHMEQGFDTQLIFGSSLLVHAMLLKPVKIPVSRVKTLSSGFSYDRYSAGLGFIPLSIKSAAFLTV